jgi:probable HAF family extracellular repeat protein
MIDLGTLGATGSEAHDINNSGQVVGALVNTLFDPSGGAWHAFLYSSGSMYDLNTPYAGFGVTFTDAFGINDLGQISAVGRVSGGRTRAFRLDPVAMPLTTLGDISTRLQVGVGDNVLIAGFIIQGPEAKKVIIRALGPTLTQFGVNGALSNPQLELHHSNGIIATNDDWQTTQLGGIITGSQTDDLQDSNLAPPNSLESAIEATLPPGNYTAIVRGVNNTTGVGLVEVYDVSASIASWLANVSSRGFVQAGDGVMIAGVIVISEPTTILVRALGPSLTQFGVAGALSNPQLELHDSSGIIATNGDWQTTEIGGIITADQVGPIRTSRLAPPSPSEAAIITTVQPGNYTAIIRGANNTTGVALAEVYRLQ